jgi:hypothetical protein
LTFHHVGNFLHRLGEERLKFFLGAIRELSRLVGKVLVNAG